MTKAFNINENKKVLRVSEVLAMWVQKFQYDFPKHFYLTSAPL